MARNLLGPIPDDHFENDPGPTPKNVTPLSEEMLEWIERLKYLARLCLRPTRRVELWLRSPVHDELW
jgi:hypothetical protein